MSIPTVSKDDLFLEQEVLKIYKGLGLYGLVTAEQYLLDIITKYNADCEGDVSFQIQRTNWDKILDEDWIVLKGYYINYMIYARMKSEAVANEQFILYERALKGLKARIAGDSGNNATPENGIQTRGLIITAKTFDRGIWE